MALTPIVTASNSNRGSVIFFFVFSLPKPTGTNWACVHYDGIIFGIIGGKKNQE